MAASVCSTTCRASSALMAVGPPLMWETTFGATVKISSAPTTEDPGIEVPPECIMTTMPLFLAQRHMAAASSGSFTDPNPTSPTTRTPWSAISSKSASVNPFSRITAPPSTFIPPGRTAAQERAAKIAKTFAPVASLGRPGR